MDQLSLIFLGCNYTLRNEYKSMNQTSSSKFRIYLPDENNLYVLMADLYGSDNTPYSGGVFKIKIEIPSDYPFRSPKITLETPIFHPNVTSGRRVIIQEFYNSKNWTPFLGIQKMVSYFSRIFNEIKPRNILNMRAAEMWTTQKDQFNKVAREWTVKYAHPDRNTKLRLAIIWLGSRKECKILNKLNSNLRQYIAQNFI